MTQPDRKGNRSHRPLVILGNGPSLRRVDFAGLSNSADSIGMNCAFRHFERINWWPTYFCSFDLQMTEEYEDDFRRISEDPDNPVERYFFWRRVSSSAKLRVLDYPGPGRFRYSRSFEEFGDAGNTGANACQVGMCLGYRKLILVGIDCSYSSGGEDYFIDDYFGGGQFRKDPRTDVFHWPAWEALESFARGNGVEVVNCGEESRIDLFRRSTLAQELDLYPSAL